MLHPRLDAGTDLNVKECILLDMTQMFFRLARLLVGTDHVRLLSHFGRLPC